MSHTIDLVGRRFGRLLVLSKTSKRDICGNVLWLCQCDCGNIVEIRTSNLKNSHTNSCGCFCREINAKRIFNDLTNKQFGFLLVIKFDGWTNNGKSMWLCKCVCGKTKRIKGNSLVSGVTLSCGCYHSKVVAENCGEKHYKWKGGFSSKDYPKEWNKYLKELIRNRDNRKCQYPNCNYDDTKEKKKLSIHHIDGNKKNCSATNLISLCNSHHLHIEQNPRLWENDFYLYTESFDVL